MVFNRPDESAVIESLFAPAYPVSVVARLTGITRWSVSRYLKGYKYFDKNKSQKPIPPVVNQSEEDSIYASFLDLIDLLYVKEFLKRGFPLQRIRRALNEAQKYLGTPHFARSEFYTKGDQIILQLPKNGDLIALMTGGQLAIPEIAKKLSNRLDFENITEFGFAQRWYPRGRSGSIVIDPRIAFGQPTLIGYGVTTSNIYDLYLGENSQVNPVSEWFNIPVPQVRTAVHFEHSLWT